MALEESEIIIQFVDLSHYFDLCFSGVVHPPMFGQRGGLWRYKARHSVKKEVHKMNRRGRHQIHFYCVNYKLQTMSDWIKRSNNNNNRLVTWSRIILRT